MNNINKAFREGNAVPYCENVTCGKRPWTDWRAEFQQYLCQTCFELRAAAVAQRLALLEQKRARRSHRRGRGGGRAAMEIVDADTFEEAAAGGGLTA